MIHCFCWAPSQSDCKDKSKSHDKSKEGKKHKEHKGDGKEHKKKDKEHGGQKKHKKDKSHKKKEHGSGSSSSSSSSSSDSVGHTRSHWLCQNVILIVLLKVPIYYQTMTIIWVSTVYYYHGVRWRWPRRLNAALQVTYLAHLVSKVSSLIIQLKAQNNVPYQNRFCEQLF